MRPHWSRHRVDSSQAEIIAALEKAGYEVFRQLPVDLLVRKRSNGSLALLECKTRTGKRVPKAKLDKRQVAQQEFCERTGTPYVTTAEEALQALRKVCPTDGRIEGT